MIPGVEAGRDFERGQPLAAEGRRQLRGEQRRQLAAVLGSSLGERPLQHWGAGRDEQRGPPHGRDPLVQARPLRNQVLDARRAGLRPVECGAERGEPLGLAHHARRVDRFHVVEVLEHRAQRHSGASRNRPAVGCGSPSSSSASKASTMALRVRAPRRTRPSTPVAIAMPAW